MPIRLQAGQSRRISDQLTVTVPDLAGATAAQAISELNAAGLAAQIVHRAQCVDPGLVIDQTPSAGTSVAPGSSITITIDSGPLHPC